MNKYYLDGMSLAEFKSIVGIGNTVVIIDVRENKIMDVCTLRDDSEYRCIEDLYNEYGGGSYKCWQENNKDNYFILESELIKQLQLND